ncbi:hypothetical protein PCASD_09046 [Puccinia coronata f. sp. avenae]|uniref:DNA polymerase delta subunit 3 n=1 Tax=Puccinia coronata f. sp. avenae TaxID=200324 RepID=A0A2N5UIN7_9BASI|nr:hypothetical protein PCASD_09046 [Puccinia coronata f. sp. avenae]
MSDPKLIRKWIRQQIILDQATVTYRDLAEEASCGADQARQLLQEFCQSEDGTRLKVEPTYLIFGTDKRVVGDCTKTSKIEMARTGQLEDLKSTFLSVSCVQIYSISATQAPDPNVFKSYTDPRVSLKPKSKNTSEFAKKESQGVDPEPKKEPKNLSSHTTNYKKHEPEDAKRASVDRTQSKPKKRKESIETPTDKKGTSESSQVKPSPKQPAKSSNKNVDTHAETVVQVPAKRSASEVDNRKDSTDKKPNPGTEHAAGTCKNGSKQTDDTSTAKATTAGEECLEGRRRVTKTRMVKKKKIVRVKDKKGYRVNREEIEEVEETYTDWESEEEEPGSQSKKKKKKKMAKTTSQSTPHPPDQQPIKPPPAASSSSAKPHPDSSELPSTKTGVTPPPQSKNKTHIVKPSKKEQSNITSFFKKSLIDDHCNK